MRRTVAIAQCVALLLAGLAAPLVHAHPGDHATEHHGRHAVHAHWDGHAAAAHSSDTPAVDAADGDRAVSVAMFVAVAAGAPHTAALTQPSFRLPVPAERAAHRTFDVVRSHDPPGVRLLSARAPPSSLS